MFIAPAIEAAVNKVEVSAMNENEIVARIKVRRRGKTQTRDLDVTLILFALNPFICTLQKQAKRDIPYIDR